MNLSVGKTYAEPKAQPRHVTSRHVTSRVASAHQTQAFRTGILCKQPIICLLAGLATCEFSQGDANLFLTVAERAQ
jgi:hypothetical protein